MNAVIAERGSDCLSPCALLQLSFMLWRERDGKAEDRGRPLAGRGQSELSTT